jgi:hypothetical protein
MIPRDPLLKEYFYITVRDIRNETYTHINMQNWRRINWHKEGFYEWPFPIVAGHAVSSRKQSLYYADRCVMVNIQ